ncbi:hypothetical protein WN944_012887 [Citrus x changshan-huyou]|uniref:Uncharacterized protein n=1 Tax=Citrus x changshan-huyou TaxID=2935761 RepID=A0AAP0QJZ1_9ROSI
MASEASIHGPREVYAKQGENILLYQYKYKGESRDEDDEVTSITRFESCYL